MSPKLGRVLCAPGEGTPSMLGDMDVLRFWSPFWHSGDGTRSFWGTFTHHQHQNDLLGHKKNYQSLKNSIFFAQNSTFPSIFLGPTFSNQRHIPHRFSDPSISMVWHITLLFSEEKIIVMTELNRHIDCIKEYKNHNETHALALMRAFTTVKK